MKCPSCGKHVRSKRQCAHCGYVFGSSDVKANAHQKKEQEPAKNVQKPQNQTTSYTAKDDQTISHTQDDKERHYQDMSAASENTKENHATNGARKEPQFVEADHHVAPKTPKKSFNVGHFIWNIIKIVLLIAIAFLLFMFGPQMFTAVQNVVTGKQEISEVMPKDFSDIVPANLFGGQDNKDGQKPSNQDDSGSPSQDEDKSSLSQEEDLSSVSEADKTPQNEKDGDKKSDNNKDQSNQEDDSDKVSQNNTENAALRLTDHKVKLDDYPVINIDFDFEGDIDEITKDTFKFNLTSNGEAKEMTDEYSLLKEGNTVKLSFADPSVNLLSAGAVKQTLQITAKDLGFDEKINYELPNSKVDQETQDRLNDIITQNLSELGDISAFVKSVDSEEPVTFVYENASVDGSNLINWFILARAHEAIRDEEITSDTRVEIDPSFIAANDEGEVASVGEGTEYLVSDLLTLMIQNNDLSAMNHLIQELGGANDFNLWLNESNYFATKVTKKLSYAEDDSIDGFVTSAQDVGRLMEALAKDDLVSKEIDGSLKELLKSTPQTEKFIQSDSLNVTNRYEITTVDSDPSSQYYTGIIETDQGQYVIAILASEVNDSAAVLPAMNQTMQDILTFLNEGDSEETSEQERTEEDTQQAPEASQAVETEAPVSSQAAETQTSQTQDNTGGANFDQIYKDENGEYATQPVQGQEPMLLPVIRDDNGNPIQVQWYYDEASQMYRYR